MPPRYVSGRLAYGGDGFETKHVLLLTSVALLLAGCGSSPNRESLKLDARERQLAPIEKPVPTLGNSADATTETITAPGRDNLVISDFVSSDPLPNFIVKGLSFTNASVYDVIRTLVSDRGIGLSISAQVAQNGTMKRNVSAYNMSGSFADLIENFSRSVGFYYSYRDGVLNIEPDREFVVSLPPVAELFEAIPLMLKNLGATDILLDKSSRIVTFRASRPIYTRASAYLKYLRETRTLITYDSYIWEVVLNDGAKMGINWRDLTSGSLTSTGMTNGASFAGSSAGNSSSFGVNITNPTDTAYAGGAGVGLIYNNGSRFGLNLLLQFLRTQGTVNNISQPKISLLSGSAAQFRSGETYKYISKTSPSTIVSGTVVAGTAETEQIETGVTMTVTGDMADGTVFTDLNLVLRDLVKFETFNAGSGVTLSLPRTAVREVSTRVRSKPGDVVVIGGINIEKADNQFTGVGPMPTSSSKSVTRSEVVVVMIPRITRFVKDLSAGRPIGGTP